MRLIYQSYIILCHTEMCNTRTRLYTNEFGLQHIFIIDHFKMRKTYNKSRGNTKATDSSSVSSIENIISDPSIIASSITSDEPGVMTGKWSSIAEASEDEEMLPEIDG